MGSEIDIIQCHGGPRVALWSGRVRLQSLTFSGMNRENSKIVLM